MCLNQLFISEPLTSDADALFRLNSYRSSAADRSPCSGSRCRFAESGFCIAVASFPQTGKEQRQQESVSLWHPHLHQLTENTIGTFVRLLSPLERASSLCEAFVDDARLLEEFLSQHLFAFWKTLVTSPKWCILIEGFSTFTEPRLSNFRLKLAREMNVCSNRSKVRPFLGWDHFVSEVKTSTTVDPLYVCMGAVEFWAVWARRRSLLGAASQGERRCFLRFPYASRDAMNWNVQLLCVWQACCQFFVKIE